MKKINIIFRGTFRILTALVAVVVPVLYIAGAAQAATLSTASIGLSDPRPSTASAVYTTTASNVTTSSIRCIRIEFDTAANGTGGKPAGLTLTGATFSGNYVPTPGSWTVTNDNTNGFTTITLAAGEIPASAAARTAILSGITNGNTAGTSYYALFSTYNNVDCSTTPVDSVSMQFIYTDGQAVSVSVDGSLSFAVAGVTGNGSITVGGITITNGLATTSTTIPFGTVTASTNKVAAQDLTVSTNAGLGYTVSTRYTGTPTTGTYTISDLATHTNATPGAFSAAGTEAFGYTTEDATLGTGTTTRFNTSNKWAAYTTSNAEVAYNGAPVASQVTRVGYQVGISGATEPGAYLSTVIYTATPVY